MTSTPPPPGPEAEAEPQSRPLAVFKAPKTADHDSTTAIADALFGERASRTIEPSGERASRTIEPSGERASRPPEVAEPESADGFTTREIPAAEPAEVPDDVRADTPRQRPATVDTAGDSETAGTRHASSPADNLSSPQLRPQGYPQDEPEATRRYPQDNPQTQASYPQESGSYPQAVEGFPQAVAVEPGNKAQSYPQDTPSASGAENPGESAPPAVPSDTDSQATASVSVTRRGRIQDIEPVEPEAENPFAEAEARVLAQINARQQAAQLAAAQQVGPQPPPDPATSRLRPRKESGEAANGRPTGSGSGRKRRTGNPFAEAEAATRAHDQARHVAAERARTEAMAAQQEAARQAAALAAAAGSEAVRPATEMTQTRSGAVRFTAQPAVHKPQQQPSRPPVTPSPPVSGPPVAPPGISVPSGQYPVVAPPHAPPQQAPPPPPAQRPTVPVPAPLAVDQRLASRPVAPPPIQQPQHSAPPARAVPEVDPRLSTRAPAPPVPSLEPNAHNQLVPVNRPPVADNLRKERPHRLPKPPKEKDRSAAQELAITEIAGHATFTPTSVTAWYRLPEVRWAFRPDPEREALISAIAEQYAGMAGYRLHLRRTTRPFPADEWARTVDANTPQPLPAVPGAANWGDHLVAAQQHLHGIQHAEGQTYLGISFARRTLSDTLSEKFGRLFSKGTRQSERTRIEKVTEQFDEVLGAFGVRARRATSHELEWLIFRSVALGMDPPEMLSGVRSGTWEPGDVLALTEQIERYRTPYGSTVKLVNRLTGEERHVAVLTVGRMEDLEIPERHEPWLHFHERAPWPMELSSRMDILGPGEAFRNLEHRLRMIRSQQNDYDEHSMDAPPELERLAQRALVVGDEMTTGMATDAARVHGWHRIAVAADDREECLERARKLIQMYNRELRISLQHPKNQDWLAREFIPGEPIANTGYLRRMPVRLFAASLPQAASTVGDQRGDLIGRTSGTCRRPVFLDLHFPTEVRERSGLAVFVAEPGGGKSTLMGALGYLAARRGVQVTLLDPSGPLARLCEMPELKPYSKVLNLTGSEGGTLAPYALIPTPKREHWEPGTEADREFHIALSNARAERRMLVQDICSMLVPPQVAREANTARLLRHAARQVPAEESSTLEDIVDCLQDHGDEGAELAALLLDTAEMPLAMLFFGTPAADMLTDDAMLTVITMAGLRLPDLKIEREYWSAEEALALPMLHTAHRLAVRRSYGGDINRRKLVGLDEAHFMEGWRSGRSFLVRMARDSRKWNLAALVASQNPKDILGLDVQNLVSTVFVGRIAEDAEIAAEALRMLRVPRDVGYEQTLASLSEANTTDSTRLPYREFIMRDVDGRVQRIRADISYVPGLLEHLDTTPGGRQAAERPTNTRSTTNPAQ